METGQTVNLSSEMGQVSSILAIATIIKRGSSVVRTAGSYPEGREFESHPRHYISAQ